MLNPAGHRGRDLAPPRLVLCRSTRIASWLTRGAWRSTAAVCGKAQPGGGTCVRERGCVISRKRRSADLRNMVLLPFARGPARPNVDNRADDAEICDWSL